MKTRQEQVIRLEAEKINKARPSLIQKIYRGKGWDNLVSGV